MITKRCRCRMLRLFSGSMLLASFVFAQGSLGATYYVAQDGDDENAGTEDEPFRTIGSGVKILGPGDTLYVREGVYPESLIYTIPGGSSWDEPVTVAAYPGEQVTIEASLYFEGPATAYIIIDGVIVDGANMAQEWPLINITYGQSPAGAAHHIRIQNSEIKNGHGLGLYINCGADYNEFINLTVQDNGSHGLYIASANNLIEDSDVSLNAGWGVHVYDENVCDGRVNNNIVRSNDVHDNGSAGSGAGIILSSGEGNTADGNRVWGNRGGGIQVDYHSIAAQITNNEVYENWFFGIFLGPGSTNAVVNGNSVYDNFEQDFVNLGISTDIQ